MRSRRKSKETDLRERYKDFFDIPQPTQNEKDNNKSKLYIGYVSTALEPVKNILSNATGYEIDTDLFDDIFKDDYSSLDEFFLKDKKSIMIGIDGIIERFNKYRENVKLKRLEAVEEVSIRALLEVLPKGGQKKKQISSKDFLPVLHNFLDNESE